MLAVAIAWAASALVVSALADACEPPGPTSRRIRAWTGPAVKSPVERSRSFLGRLLVPLTKNSQPINVFRFCLHADCLSYVRYASTADSLQTSKAQGKATLARKLMLITKKLV